MQHTDEHLVPVQADALNDSERADTELARQAASLLGWQIQPHVGTIHDQAGKALAKNIEELAHAARLLGWFNPYGVGLDRRKFDQRNPDQSADSVRRTLAQSKEKSDSDTPI